MATFADFKLRYPELVSAADANEPAIQAYLDEAEIMLNLAVCPKISDSLQMAYAAHLLAKSGNNPNGMDTSNGPANSESVGSVSISYQIAESKGASNDWWRSTSYGQDFVRLRRMCFGASVRIAP